MAIGLPILTYALVVMLLRLSGRCHRESLLLAAVVWGTFTILSTEVLSLFGWVTQAGLIGLWTLAAAVAGLTLWRRVRRSGWGDTGSWLPSELSSGDITLLGGGAILVGLVGLTALVAPPNTWDSMEYHLPRVFSWLDQGHVGHYPTPGLKQLRMAPGAEFIMLHLHGLAGGDRFVNLVQWFSYLGSAVGVSVIARELGAGRRGQVLAALAAVTIPHAVLYASGPKNDLVAGLWLVIALAQMLAFRRRPSWTDAFWVGAALGLAGVTKPTAYLFALPLMGLLILSSSRPLVMNALKKLPVVVGMVAILSIGFWIRNVQLGNSPFGAGAESADGKYQYANGRFDLGVLASNVVRNLALHAGTPSTKVNHAIERGVVSFLRAVGQDPNDPDTTWTNSRFKVEPLSRNEATTGNPLHMLLSFISLALILGRRELRRMRELLWFSAGLVLAFLVFCAVLRWQPWHTRLHLPLFVLGSGVLGVVLERALRPGWGYALGVLLLLAASPFALLNASRPLLPPGSIFDVERRNLYYGDRPAIRAAHLAAASRLRRSSCRRIGIHGGNNHYFYPLLMSLKEDGITRKIRYVGVTNQSARFASASASFPPCAVVCLGCKEETQTRSGYAKRFGEGKLFGDSVVYLARSRLPSAHAKRARLQTVAPPPPRPKPPPPRATLPPVPPARGCEYSLVSGWHLPERTKSNWVRWTRGRGEIRVRSDIARTVDLEADLYSLRRPNDVEVYLDGRRQRTIRVVWQGFATLPPIRLDLPRGQSRVVIVSRTPGARSLADRRLRAVAVRDLSLRISGSRSFCRLRW